MMNPRLPLGWSEKPHRCDLPASVYFDVKIGDIYTCHICLREWRVCGIRHGNQHGYDRYHINFSKVNY